MHPFNLDRLVPEYIRNFETYIPSRPDQEFMRLYGISRLNRLNNNENWLGPPEQSRTIIEQFPSERAAIYPQGDCYYLRQGLAEKFSKDPEQFLVGNGSTEVIASVIKAFCEQGDNIITADKTFAVYEWIAEFSGFEARLIPLKDFGFDPDAMLAAMDERTRIIFVCNPNNPTGTWWDQDTLINFLEQVDSQSIVVIDEAYVEYVEQENFPDCMSLMEQFPNLVVFRTFSKMYALAALRVGYLCGSLEVLDIIRRTHVVYSVNTLAQEAALAAITDDQAHIKQTRAMVNIGKQILSATCSELGLDFLCGQGSYMMIKVPLSDTLLYRKLLKQGMMIRTMTGFRFPGWIRVSMGEEDVMRNFSKILTQTLQA